MYKISGTKLKGSRWIFFSRNGIAFDRIVGFQDLGSKDDFTIRALENLLKRKGKHFLIASSYIYAGRYLTWFYFSGIIDEKQNGDDDADDAEEYAGNRSITSSTVQYSDSD